MPARNCGACHWFDKDFAEMETPEESLGLCKWPADRLPFSLRYGNRERAAVGPLEGEGCATFEVRSPIATPTADMKPPAGATCQEASPMSHETYIACGKPAIAVIKTNDPQAYLMCFGCADHNVKNRGARRVQEGEMIEFYRAEA